MISKIDAALMVTLTPPTRSPSVYTYLVYVLTQEQNYIHTAKAP